jgi:dihydrofolate reductase
MARVTCHMSVSLDGFVTGPDQTRDDPIGRGGMALHQWHFDADQPVRDVDARMRDAISSRRGAYVMGRNMFGPVRGGWGDEDWRGWWGAEPPYHAPVFVLTHHSHDPIEMDGGTTFHFVTDGFDVALAAAVDAARDLDVDIAGGASTVQQALRTNVIDDLVLDIVPITLGSGERLLDNVPGLNFEPVEVAHSPHATHISFLRRAVGR